MLDVFFELGINVVESYLVIYFISHFFGFRHTLIQKNTAFILGWLMLFLVTSILNSLFHFEGIVGAISYLLIIFIYAYFCLNGHIATKIFLSIFTVGVVCILAIASNLLMSVLMNRSPIEIFIILDSTRIVAVLMSKLALFFVINIILRIKNNGKMNFNNALVFIVIPVISLLTLIFVMDAAMTSELMKKDMLMITVGIIITNILLYYSFVWVVKEDEIKTEYLLLQQSYENDKKNAENIQSLYQEAYGLKHNIENDLTVILGLIENGNKEEAEATIRNILKQCSVPLQKLVNTGNKAFDAIANAKLILCHKKRIYINMRVMKNSLFTISPHNIGVLFGNLFDNAIEAAELSEEKYISLDVQIQGAYISIFMKNSIASPVLKTNYNLRTTKVQSVHHGFGIKHIKKVVLEYDGIIRFFEENGRFCCDILLEK